MSSHHFVKEGQEPALFILDPIAFELASPYLEWAPVVLVSEDALDAVLLWKIKIDAVLTIPAREKAIQEKVAQQAPVEVICLRPEDSMTTLAFSYLISSNQASVNVLTSRPENVFLNAEMVISKLQINIIDSKLRWSGISAGRFEKWVSANTPIAVRKSLEFQSVKVYGLIENEVFFESNKEGMISILSDSFFWVAESHS
jgi:hypothetical protein